MLLMLEHGIRGGICYSIYQFVKSGDKYMKDFFRKRIIKSSKLEFKKFIWYCNVTKSSSK